MVGRRLAALALCCSSCFAQFAVSAFAHTNLSGIIMPHGFGGVYSVSPGTDITSGLNILVNGVGAAVISLNTSLQVAQDRIAFTVVNTASPPNLTNGGTADSYYGTIRLVVTTTRQLTGRFVLEWIDQSDPVLPQVDLGGDGTVEFAPTASATATIPLLIPVGTFIVLIGTGASSHYTSPPASSTLHVTYEPDTPFTATQLSNPCGVTQTVTSNFFDGVDLISTGLPFISAGIGGQVIGFQSSPPPVLLPFPPGCFLNTYVVLTSLLWRVLNGPAGTARLVIDMSAPGLRPIQFNAQSAWLDLAAGTVATSNAVRVVCQ